MPVGPIQPIQQLLVKLFMPLFVSHTMANLVLVMSIGFQLQIALDSMYMALTFQFVAIVVTVLSN
jgi:hypothetical protein